MNCPSCTEDFIPTHVRQRYCAPACRNKMHSRTSHGYPGPRLNNPECGYCGVTFDRAGRKVKYCSTECRRSMVLFRAHKRDYGMTVADYAGMLAAQGGGCAICHEPPDPTARKKVLSVDHDHKTGRVRGLLCHGCNVALGHFGDDVDRLTAAIAYLKR